MNPFLRFIAFSVMIASILLFIRNKLVHKAVMKALEITSDKANKAIDKKEDWEKFYEKLHSYGTYTQMVFDLTKWKFNQFYPDV